LRATIRKSHALAMFVFTDAQAAAIRTTSKSAATQSGSSGGRTLQD
jgi:hypothetical protein